jgi:pyruvate/2-oxoglutarate dehydrogenase complex dihydrolipoamide dehydrogenase (E3) component
MTVRYDLVIVGMGSGGMTAAEFATTLDLNVAIVERGRIGGDCLWTGCVPSKALLASAKAAHAMRNADAFGLAPVEPTIDLAMVWRRVRSIQADIARTDDNPARYRDMGLTIFDGDATLTGPNEVTVTGAGGEHTVIDARFIMLCTGSSADVPQLEGLAGAGYLTSENLFELDSPPSSMIVLGGGPVGVEMSQAFVRLGIRTTLVQHGPRILPRDEPTLVQLLTASLRRDGVELILNAEPTRVTTLGTVKTLHTRVDEAQSSYSAEGILVATGRTPNTVGLGLEALGIEVGDSGVTVDNRGRTSVRSIYAAGDVAGRYRFTHSAGYEAVRAVRDMFFPGKGNVDDFIPWCTFTDPELAHAGLTIAEAEAAFGDDMDVWRIDLTHNDRARTDSATEGAVVVVTTKGRVVGAHILAPAAGEMIHELALAIRHDMKISDVANLVHVYPTYATAIGQVAAESAFERAQKLRWLVRR